MFRKPILSNAEVTALIKKQGRSLSDEWFTDSRRLYNKLAEKGGVYETAASNIQGREKIIQAIRDVATPDPTHSAIELGHGLYAPTIGLGFGSVHLVDNAEILQKLAANNFDYAKKHPGEYPEFEPHANTTVRFVNADVRTTKIPAGLNLPEDARFEVATLLEVLTHLTPLERFDLINRIALHADNLIVVDRHETVKRELKHNPQLIDGREIRDMIARTGRYTTSFEKFDLPMKTDNRLFTQKFFLIKARRK